jgi:prevent-host-death family protein
MITTAKNLRFHTKEILETTMRGEEVVITYRGKPTAKVIPFSDDQKMSKEKKPNGLFGIWKDKTDAADVSSYLRKIRKGRKF